MPRNIIKRYLPDSDKLRNHRHLSPFGEYLHNRSLWHFNRRSVAGGAAVGLFTAFVPLPFQMVIAAALAILTGVNLPLSVALVWLTNPLTMGPIFYTCYRLGAILLGIEGHVKTVASTNEHMIMDMLSLWKPLLLGCTLVGVCCAVLGWATVHLLWRWHVVSKRWPKR